MRSTIQKTERQYKATSTERREARFQRRRAAREAKKARANRDYDDFEKVFSYEHLYEAYKKCRRNVAWKSSVQRYISNAPLFVRQTRDKLLTGTWKSSGFFEFDVSERGHTRHIRSVTISERVVQRCLCDYALVPVLSRTFVYDNAASLKNKGYHFAMRRMKQHLREHYRKYGNKGYILLFDFRKFFDNVSHEVCKAALRGEFRDERIIALTEHFINMFGDRGLGLGNQISQTFALASANRLDHYIKDVCGIRGYGRYMDDGYLIAESKEKLQAILSKIREVCRQIGLELHEKKTHIVKLSHGFTFLQARFYLLDTGKVLCKIPRASVTRERRRLKRLRGIYLAGRMTARDIYDSFQSWRAYARNFNAYRSIRNMEAVYCAAVA